MAFSYCLQIVGEIKATRDAFIEVTSRLRSYLYREFFQKDSTPPSISVPGPVGSALGMEAASPNKITPAREGQTGSDPPTATSQNVQTVANAQLSKVVLINGLRMLFCLLILASLALLLLSPLLCCFSSMTTIYTVALPSTLVSFIYY